MRRFRRALGLIGAIAASSWGLAACNRAPAPSANQGATAPSVRGAPANPRVRVAALGRLKPLGEVIQVGATVGDRVKTLSVADGQFVRKGDELAILDSHPDRLAQKNLALAQLEQARLRLNAERALAEALVKEAEVAIDQLAEPADLGIRVQEATVRLLEAKLASSKVELQRLEELLKTSAVTRLHVDRQELIVKKDREELTTAEIQLAKLKADRDLARTLAQQKLQTAKAGLQKAETSISLRALERELELAEAQLEKSVIRAPCDGEILKIETRPGETIGAKPILLMGGTHEMAAVAEVYQTDVGRVQIGQRAKITSPALPGPLTGTVRRIAKTVARNQILAVDPTADRDARVVDVTIALDDSASAGRMVQLEVDVEIDTTSTPASETPREHATPKTGAVETAAP